MCLYFFIVLLTHFFVFVYIYFVLIGDPFCWAFSCMQWNCMARSVNIDNMTFSQMSLGKDSMIIKYDDSKTDQTGEKTSPKNCYPNPFDVRVCLFTALGCYLAISDEAWSYGNDRLDRLTVFRSKKAKSGSASHK